MAKQPIAFMFSGQGSHYFQMGRELFATDGVFREWMQRLDAIARDQIGESVVQALYAPERRKTDPFDHTVLTHPAIFMVEYALARTLMHHGVQPDCVLGVSVGSFTAAAVGEFLDAEDAMRMVLEQAGAIERHAAPGGMVAVMAPHSLHWQEEELRATSEVAAVNFESHFTLAAPAWEMQRIEAALATRQVAFQRLAVSAPFHSRWIDAARAPFAASYSARTHQGRLPLFCCQRADVLWDLPKDYFWDVVRKPIQLRKTVARLELGPPPRYIDVGPAGTLATFLKYLLPPETRSRVHSVLTLYGGGRDGIARILVSTRN